MRFALKSFVDIKGTFHPITDHKRTQEKYIYTLSLTSALDVGGGVNAKPCCFIPRQRAPVPIVEKDGQGPVPKWTGVEKRKSLPLTGVKIIGRKVKHFATKIRTDFASLMSAASTAGPDAKWRLLKMLTHYSGRVTQICVFSTVKLGTSASSP